MKIGGHIAKTRSPNMMMLDDTLTLDDTSGLSPSRFHLLGIIVFVFWSMINSRVQVQTFLSNFHQHAYFFRKFHSILLDSSRSKQPNYIPICKVCHCHMRQWKKYIFHQDEYIQMIRILWQKKYCSSSMLDILALP